MSKPVRLDALLVKLGLAASRARARELIEEGSVMVDGIVSAKAARQVRPEQTLTLVREDHQWVGRGALKLLGAIEPMGVDPTDMTCADLGSSTGGFTQVLLHKGAVRVYAIDVGTNQLAWSLRTDDRVVVMEGVNARYLDALPEPMDLVVGDLSFISLSLILPTVARILRPGGRAVLLVKPQFEAGRDQIAKGGRVRSDAARADAIAGVVAEAQTAGFHVLDQRDCVLAGAKAGNIEHFIYIELAGAVLDE